jgi:hypothetical protein
MPTVHQPDSSTLSVSTKTRLRDASTSDRSWFSSSLGWGRESAGLGVGRGRARGWGRLERQHKQCLRLRAMRAPLLTQPSPSPEPPHPSPGTSTSAPQPATPTAVAWPQNPSTLLSPADRTSTPAGTGAEHGTWWDGGGGESGCGEELVRRLGAGRRAQGACSTGSRRPLPPHPQSPGRS